MLIGNGELVGVRELELMCDNARKIVYAHDSGALAHIPGHGPVVAAARALVSLCDAGLGEGPLNEYDPDPPYIWEL